MVQSKTVNAAGAAEIFDLEKVRSAKLVTQPFDYLIASSFIRPQWRAGLIADYPTVEFDKAPRRVEHKDDDCCDQDWL